MAPPYILEVDHLVKAFGKVVAVNDISFSVNESELFGFLGPNGAGKTTAISILCTLLRPTSGKARVNGFDVVREQSQVRQSIGLVFQDQSLDIQLTALENMRFHAAIYNIPSSVRNNRIQQMLEVVELWERRNDIVKTFSGGMKRRLELARGLLHYPKVLFLDEPTLGLDPQTRNRLWGFILELRKKEGITIFLTTHYMDEATNADRIAIIDHGKIVALDSPGNLKSMVSGDIVRLKTADDQKAVAEIRDKYQLEPQIDGEGISLQVTRGEEFIPELARDFGTQILSIGLRRPTLDDAFLKLTGHELRDEVQNGREMIKDHGRRGARR
ncbi:MAG: ATP-binding cassette domain-containing protein [Chloroflexota bacterium]|nr:ATP-binding cassette domain-containing protein [Chloroflexota bacterium]